jgi:phosphoribosylformylglycinamidine synthase subunit PurS
MLARITVTLKNSVLDPQGVAVKNALSSLGYDSVGDVRMGKYLEVRLDEADPKKAEKQLQEMCDKLLANPVIEEYHYDIQMN